jgi:hypothetical protein
MDLGLFKLPFERGLLAARLGECNGDREEREILEKIMPIDRTIYSLSKPKRPIEAVERANIARGQL